LLFSPEGLPINDISAILPFTMDDDAISPVLYTSLGFIQNERVRLLPPIRAFMLRKQKKTPLEYEVLRTLADYIFPIAAKAKEVGSANGGAVVKCLTAEMGNLNTVIKRALVSSGPLKQDAIRAAFKLTKLWRLTGLGDVWVGRLCQEIW
jgi:hypothetical protein